MNTTATVLAIAAFLISNYCRAEKIITKKSIGHGDSVEAATINGLIEALRQVRGVAIWTTNVARTTVGQKNEDTKITSVQSNEVRSAAGGYVRSYQIESVLPVDGGGWEVRLNAEIDALNSIAVRPFRVLESKRSGDELSRQLTGHIHHELTSSHRLRVVSEDPRSANPMPADYVIDGTISKLQIANLYNESSGKRVYYTEASVSVDYRLVRSAPEEVIWSNSLTRTVRGPLVEDRDILMIEQDILRQVAKRLVMEAMDELCPISVLLISEKGSIYLDQGHPGVERGQFFEVFSKSDSTRPLTTIRAQIAEPNHAVAQIFDGTTNGIAFGSVCRRARAAKLIELQKRQQSRDIAVGICPSLDVAAAHRGSVMMVSVWNNGPKVVFARATVRRVLNFGQAEAWTLRIRAKDREDLGFSSELDTGDSISFECDGYSVPFQFWFR